MIRKFILQGLFFFLILGILGSILRLKMAIPFLPQLHSNFLIHAHSHIAVLGWTNVIFMAFILYFTFSKPALGRLSIKFYFWALLIVNLGIAPSFMAQGYGVVSIIFSTCSIVLSIWFLFLYFRSQDPDTKHTVFHRFFTTGIIFYVCSAFGLVMVAMHMAAKIGGEGLFNAGVYFYLHSQYNGWMIFVLIGSIYSYLHKQGVAFSTKTVQWQWVLLTISFIPTYLPQIYALQLPAWLVIIGFVGTVLSFAAVILFLQTTFKPMLGLITNKGLRLLFGYSMLAFLIKSMMEIGGAIPALASIIHANRQVVIGYLHLTLLALISTYLFFAIYQYWLKTDRSLGIFSILYVTGTFLMVFTLFLDGLLKWLQIHTNGITLNTGLTILSILITLAGVIPFVQSLAKKKMH